MNQIKTVIGLIFLVGMFGLWFTKGVAAGKEAKPTLLPLQVGDAKRGENFFQDSCKQCHNAHNQESLVGPGLQGLFKGKKMPATGRQVSVSVVKSQIRKGGNGMPSFANKFKAAEVDDLVAYLKTL